MRINIIKIQSVNIHEHHLDLLFGADQFKFSTKIFYHNISFQDLIYQYSQAAIDRIAAVIALFEGMKFCSLFPDFYDITAIASHLDQATLDLFARIYHGVFAQHRYENNAATYAGPAWMYAESRLGHHTPIVIPGDHSTLLVGCGGGKDSAVAMKIFQESEIPFATMQYSHSVYGKADFQHHLISNVIQHVTPQQEHKLCIVDDFSSAPFLQLYFPDCSGITMPETPVSIFEALPIMLSEGYRYLSLAHEKSANMGNLIWEEVGEEVNHQWGKSYEAEQLLNKFIQDNLISNIHYFSILQPIYDWRIFKILARYPELVSSIHSCNLRKPWCKKCPKCAYVWLGLMAFFDADFINQIFKINLFDDDDLMPIFKQLIGLSDHTPFECIGEIGESRLAMKRCLEKGVSGQVLDLFKAEVLGDQDIDWPALEHHYGRLYHTDHAIPDWIYHKVKDRL